LKQIIGSAFLYKQMTRWPSGLRRNVKAVVFIGGGSNPPRVIPFAFRLIELAFDCLNFTKSMRYLLQ
jgi:hypothetical protein